ncbi:hypothetical protein [uncultured Sphingomonas sp.]|uniref:hypothetical protein n=1 Tax=uncultured Sphingomonas sp. TaxID=158754 RepID=UPI0035CBEFCA
MLDYHISTLATVLDGIADVLVDHPFPRTTLARVLEDVLAKARDDVDNPLMLGMGEGLLCKAWEQAEAEHFR